MIYEFKKQKKQRNIESAKVFEITRSRVISIRYIEVYLYVTWALNKTGANEALC